MSDMTGKKSYHLNWSVSKPDVSLESDLAQIVSEELIKVREKGAMLGPFVLMPDHVHVLLVPGDSTISSLVNLIKGRSSYRAGEGLELEGQLWNPGYYCKRLQNKDGVTSVKQYIRLNPVREGLVEEPDEYPWLSLDHMNPREQDWFWE